MKRFLPMTLGLTCLVFAEPVSAQSMDRAFSSLEKSIDRVEARSKKDAALSDQDISNLKGQAETVRANANQVAKPDQGNYAKSLNAQADLLNRAAVEPSPASTMRLYRDALDDLSLKTGASGLNHVAPPFRGNVKVTAHTKRDGAEVVGFVVGANPVSLSGSSDMMFRFEKLSSPTSKSLPPGRYEFMLSRGNKVVSRTRADVGLTSADDVELDLDLSAATTPPP